MSIDWSKAPEGATHAAFLPDIQQHLFFKFADGRWFDVKNQEWSCIGGKPNFDLIERPKTLTQAVFDGLPSEYRWAGVEASGKAYACICELTPKQTWLFAKRGDPLPRFQSWHHLSRLAGFSCGGILQSWERWPRAGPKEPALCHLG